MSMGDNMSATAHNNNNNTTVALARSQRIPTNPGGGRNARSNVPAFLQKLHEMLDDPESRNLIQWSEQGDSFFVLDTDKFAREILGKWFKHQNFNSFVRQLNMYGFHKIPHLRQGVLRSDTPESDHWNFSHEYFQRGRGDLMGLIQRKKGSQQQQQQQQAQQQQIQGSVGGGGGQQLILGGLEDGTLDIRDPNTPLPAGVPATTTTTTTATTTSNAPANLPTSTTTSPGSNQRTIDVATIVQGIAAIQRHQHTISEELNELKSSNRMLWQESLSARERLQRQDDTLARIIRFLAGVFGNRRTEGGEHDLHRHHGHGHHRTPSDEDVHEDGRDGATEDDPMSGGGGGGGRVGNQGAVIPVRGAQRRTSPNGPRRSTRTTPTTGGGIKPRLMIEGAKHPPEKQQNVGIVEIPEGEGEDGGHDELGNGKDDDGVINIEVDGDEDEDEDDEVFGDGGDGEEGDGKENLPYAVETPTSVPSPAPSITQSENAGPTIAETTTPVVSSNPNLGYLNSSMNDAAMNDASKSNNTNTTTALDRAVTPSRLTTAASPPAFELDPSLQTLLANLTPDALAALINYQVDPTSSSPIDQNANFASTHDATIPNNTPGQLTTFNNPTGSGTANPTTYNAPPSPSAFDWSSLGNFAGLSPGLTGGFPALSPGPGGEGLLSFHDDHDNQGGGAGVSTAVSPRLDRHWRDIQDVDKEVAENQQSIDKLMAVLQPYMGTTGGGVSDFSNLGSLSDVGANPTHATGGTNSGVSTAAVPGVGGAATTTTTTTTNADDISSLNPSHLTMPSDFDFHSYFPHNPSDSSDPTSTSTSTNHLTSHHSTTTSLAPSHSTGTHGGGAIDSTMDMSFDMGDISSLRSGMPPSSYTDLSGPETAFLDEVPSSTQTSPVAGTTTTVPPGLLSGGAAPGSPVSSRNTRTRSGTTSASGIGRKRKSDMMAMSELEGALLGATSTGDHGTAGSNATGNDGTVGGAEIGSKMKRRKD